MTAGGWVMLVGSWAFIIALCVFCGYKLFTEKPAESITEPGAEPGNDE